MGRSTAAGAAALGALALCGACSQGHSLPSPLPTDVPYAYHLQTEPGGSGALLEGTLELQDGCLVVLPSYEGVDDDLPPAVPVLPIAVTTWDGTTLAVDGEATAVGEEITLGGGSHAEPTDAAFVPQTCPTGGDDRYFIVGIQG
jgi:hypothetical protein